MENPKNFAQLTAEQLKEAADNFGIDHDGTRNSIIKGLKDDGVTWEVYSEAAGLNKKNVVTSADVRQKKVEEKVNKEDVVVAQPTELQTSKKYLIRMTRENPMFQHGRYTFTQDNPFALMEAEDAQQLLTTEKGFRQAFEAELEEYYS